MVGDPHVLLLSFEGDAHATAIRERLVKRFGVRATLWDTSGIPADQRLSISLPHGKCTLSGLPAGVVDLGSLTSCWWRRPLAAVIPDEVEEEEVRRYCRRESDRLIRGALLAADVPLINDPIRQSRADHKPLQLRLAQEVGLTIPQTLITNDPGDAIRFVEAQVGGCIFKAFQSPSWRIVETRKFHESMKLDLGTLRFAPVIFQELVPLGRDIRIAVLRDRQFAAEVLHRAPEAVLDWRLDPNVEWNPLSLPADLRERIAILMDRLGLLHGSLDVRQTPGGEFVFLEVNPSGQFLFLEQPDGTEIADAFCELLLGGGRTSRTAGRPHEVEGVLEPH